MSISALVQEMVDAGASPQMIAIAVRAVESASAAAVDTKAEDRRAKDRERKRVRRHSADIPRTGEDISAEVPEEVSPPCPPIDNNKTLTPQSTPSTTTDRSRGSRLPEGWSPDEAGKMIAVNMLGSNASARAELEKFRDFWAAKAGADGRKVDWAATWRNWIRRASERSPAMARASPRTAGRFSADPYVNALAEAVDHDRQSQFAHDD